MAAKVQQGITTSAAGPRIAPVNISLVTAVRPVPRDPRLLGKTPAPQNSLPLNTHNSIIVENNYKVKNSTKTHNITNDIASSTDSKLSSVNKVVAHGGTLNRKDPRLHSKVQGPLSFKGKPAERDRSRSPVGSNTSGKSQSTNSSASPMSSPSKSPARKSVKSQSRTSFNNRGSAKGGSAKTAPTSSPKSPSKHKKKTAEHSPRTSEKRAKAQKSDKRSKDRGVPSTIDQVVVRTSPVPTTVATVPVTPERAFKELKPSTKNRNYVRRNRELSVSPEPSPVQDVDLRVCVAPPEKQPRLQANATTLLEEATVKSKTNMNENCFGSVLLENKLDVFVFYMFEILIKMFWRINRYFSWCFVYTSSELIAANNNAYFYFRQ